MKKELILLVLSLSCISMEAQNSIYGNFVDTQTVPVENVLIQLVNKSDSVAIGIPMLSDSNGFFRIEYETKNEVMISYTRFNTVNYLEIPPGVTNYNIGIVVVNEIELHLNEVAIVGRKPLFQPKIDRLVVNVKDNLSLTGGSVLETLSRSPGVNINRERNLITLNSKEGVIIMFDGKESRLPLSALIQTLDGMPSQNIEKIELISNPGTKYDAGSTGGIINIVTIKNNQKGINIQYNLMGGYVGKEGVGTLGIVNYKKNKLNTSFNFGYYRTHNDQEYELKRNIFNQNDNYDNYTFSERDPLSNYISAKLGIDYDMSEKNKIGGFISGHEDYFKLEAITTARNKKNGLIVSDINVQNSEKNKWYNLASNIYYNYKDNQNELNIDLNYLHYYNNNSIYNINHYIFRAEDTTEKEISEGVNKAPVHAGIFSIDYTNNITEKSKLEIGSKFTTGKYRNTINLENSKMGEVTKILFNLNENVYAAYINYDFELNRRIHLQLGVRYEYFNLKSKGQMGEIKRKSGDWFPNLNVSYKLNPDNTFYFTYNRRVSRPTYNDFSPYNIFIDPSTSFTGNESLNQSISNGIKIDYQFKKYYLSIQYTDENNGISRFQPQANLEDNTLYYSSINLKYKRIYNILLTIPFEFTSWMSMQNNFMGVRQEFKTDHLEENIEFKKNSLEFRSSLTFAIPKGWKLDLSGFYHTPQLYGFSMNKSYGNLSLGIEKKINDRHTFRFNMNNLVGKYRDWDIVDEKKLNYYYNARYDMNPLTAVITYTFNFSRGELGQSKSGTNNMDNRIR